MKGIKDNLPSVYTSGIEFVRKTFEQTSFLHAFDFVYLPLIEEAQLYFRTSGVESELCNKELFEVRRYKDEFRDWVLRPEGTASCIRALNDINFLQENKHAKLAYFAPMFRYNRPQRGRYRQFLHAGWEYVGNSSIYADLEVLQAAYNFLKKLNIDFTLEINSIGTAEDRVKYRQVLHEKMNIPKEKDPLKFIDKIEDFDNIPKLEINDQDKLRFEKTQQLLESLKIPFKVNPYLVRGLDYYNGLVFEFKTNVQTILAGGRYDKLMEQIGKNAAPAVGFAAGVERLVEHMNYQHENKKIAILPLDAPEYGVYVHEQVCQLNLSCDVFWEFLSLKKAFAYFEKKEYEYVIICGNNEKNKQEVVIKNLKKKTEQSVGIEKVKYCFFL